MPSSIKKTKASHSPAANQNVLLKNKRAEMQNFKKEKIAEIGSFEKAKEFCIKTFELLCLTSEQQFVDKKHHGFHDYSVK